MARPPGGPLGYTLVYAIESPAGPVPADAGRGGRRAPRGEARTALPAEAGEPLTIWEAAFRVTWNRTWAEPPATLRGMAAGEAAAHLRTLDVRGAIRRIPGVDPVRFAVHSETSDV
ncbi:hypothetical protein [Streptosporangium sp. NPDC006007]|uniref:hypothetical protein n=1 Tax=Streptosporangium sp. NPDC006007 TaxID=3154575 RepID=UPI00339E267D